MFISEITTSGGPSYIQDEFDIMHTGSFGVAWQISTGNHFLLEADYIEGWYFRPHIINPMWEDISCKCSSEAEAVLACIGVIDFTED
jgi:hypothetical protein